MVDNNKKSQIKALLKAMEKPSLPTAPKKLNMPEPYVWIQRSVPIRNFSFDHSVDDGGWGDDSPCLSHAVLSESDLTTINQAVRECKDLIVNLTNIKDFQINLYSECITYCEKISNPNFEKQRKKLEPKLKEYEKDLEKYKKLKSLYDIALAEYEKNELMNELERTRKRLVELEQKVGK